jgi:hypothetical protein
MIPVLFQPQVLRAPATSDRRIRRVIDELAELVAAEAIALDELQEEVLGGGRAVAIVEGIGAARHIVGIQPAGAHGSLVDQFEKIKRVTILPHAVSE